MSLVAGALGATVLVLALAYIRRVHRRETTVPVPENLPANVHQQASGYTFTRSEGGRRIFTVHADRTVAFNQGQPTVLEGVTVEVFGRTGNRHDFLRAHSCEYDTKSGGIVCSGPVEIELNAPAGGPSVPEPATRTLLRGDDKESSGLAPIRGQMSAYLEASKVSFQPQGSLVLSDELIRFRFGPASGSARGFAFATREGWLELKQDVVAELPRRGEQPGPGSERVLTPPQGSRSGLHSAGHSGLTLRLMAAALRYEKDTGQVMLRGPLQITQGARRIEAGAGAISLDARNHVERAILEGGVKAFDRGCLDGSAASWDRSPVAPAGSDAVGCDSAETLTASAQRVEGDLDPSSGLLRNLVAEDDVQAEARRACNWGASVSRLSARNFQMSFVEDRDGGKKASSSEPLSAKASGDVHLSVESRPVAADAGSPVAHAERKELSASEVLFDFRPESRSLKELRTVGPGTLTWFPSDPKDGTRLITAGQFLMAFDSRSRMESLEGLSPTRIVFEPVARNPHPAPQESSADQLEAQVDPSTQTLTALEQSGNFQFKDGDRQARADRAQYTAATQRLALTGSPRLWNTETRVRADRFLIDLRNDRVEGAGRVQSVSIAPPSTIASGEARTPSAGPASPVATGKSANVHAGLKPGATSETGETTNVLADRMMAERNSQLVHYEGHVRAWHGFDVIESPSLDIYRNERRISSGEGVVTSHLEPAARAKPRISGSKGEMREVGPLTVRADKLDYFDAQHQAIYQGHVRAGTEDLTLAADHAEVYFSLPAGSPAPEGSAAVYQVDRILADGNVRVVEPTRRASSNHAEYLAGPGKIVMTGGFPSIYDAKQGITTGQRLTFFIHDDSLFVDGGEQSPTLAKRRVVR